MSDTFNRVQFLLGDTVVALSPAVVDAALYQQQGTRRQRGEDSSDFVDLGLEWNGSGDWSRTGEG